MSSRLFDALDQRFNDFDECKDVMNHGMTGGFSGFIYTSEINKFFDEHKNEIEDYLHMILGDNYIKEVCKNFSTVDNIITQLVWYVVECYCTEKVLKAEAAFKAILCHPIEIIKSDCFKRLKSPLIPLI